MTNFPPPMNDGQRPPFEQKDAYGTQSPYAQRNFQGFSAQANTTQGQMPPYVFQGKPPMGAGKIILIVLGSIIGFFIIATIVGVVIGVSAVNEGESFEYRSDAEAEKLANERLAADPEFGHKGEIPDPTFISPKGEFGAYFLRRPTVERFGMESPNWQIDDYESDTYFTDSNSGIYTLVRNEFLEQDRIDMSTPGAKIRARELIKDNALALASANRSKNSKLKFAKVDGAIDARSFVHGPIYDSEIGQNIYYQMLAVVTTNAYYELSWAMIDSEPASKIDFFRAFTLYGDHKNPRKAPIIEDPFE